MTYVDRGVAGFWSSVAASTAPSLEGLGLLRAFSGLFILLVVPPYAYWVGEAPATFFAPPAISPMALSPGFPSSLLMWLADALGLVGACGLLLGVHGRACSLLVTVVGVLSSNAAMSFGKIDHDAMFWAFFGCMTFSGWGRTFALRPDRPSRFDRPNEAFALMAVLLAFAMTATGLHKALGWVDFDLTTSGFLGWFVRGYYVLGRRDLLADQVPNIPVWGFELMDYSGVAFEVGGSVALLVGPRIWRSWILCACLFHLLNVLTLNIPFLQNLLIYLAFADSSAVQRKLEPWLEARPVRIVFAAAGVAMVLAHLALRRAGVGRWLLFVFDESRDSPLVLRFSAALFSGAFLVVLMDVLRRRAARPPETLPDSLGAR